MANPQTENGHVKIACEIAEAMSHLNLSAYENRLLWVIIRKTYGWNKKTDRISFSQFEEASGIDRRHVARAIKSLKERAIISCFGKGYQLEYGLQKNYDLWILTPKEAMNIDTHIGNDLTPKEAILVDTYSGNETTPIQATNTGDNLTPLQDNLTPLQDKSTPKEATNLTPIQANTKAIKHLTKDNIQKTDDLPVLPDWLDHSLFTGFMDMRKRIKKPMTNLAIKLAIEKLDKFRSEGENPNEILKRAILGAWQGLYSLKDKGNGKKTLENLIAPRNKYVHMVQTE